MKCISVHIPKGGCGKTSLAGNTAAVASKSVSTVLVDADPQGSASSWFLGTRSIRSELCDVLAGEVTVKEALIDVNEGFGLLPTAGLGGGLKKWAETRLFHEPFVFEDLNGELEKLGVDLAIYDLSPGLSMLERAVILACDEVISPLSPEYFSLDGLEAFAEAIGEINRAYRRSVKHRRVVVNMINNTFKTHKKNRTLIERLDYELYMVPQDRAIPDAQAEHVSLAEFRPDARSLPEIQRLAAAIVR